MPWRTVLVVVLPAVLLVGFAALLGWMQSGDAQLGVPVLNQIHEWLAQTVWGVLAVPFWLGVAAMALRCATSPDVPARSAVVWTGLQVFIVTFALGLGFAMLRSGA